MRILIGALVLIGAVQAGPQVPEIQPDDFARLQAAIRPQPDESPWRDIDWMTSLRGARQRAAAEGKPILVFTAADGSPLARTWGACTSNRARWCTGSQVDPKYVMAHFVPVALDTYFRGAGDEMEFCRKIKAGGNHMVVATAAGTPLGGKDALRMREKELAGLLEDFKALPEEERKPKIDVPADVAPPKRKLPDPPANGLILKGYCTYVRSDGGKIVRSREWYYRDNPDRWPAETQNDMLWLTEAEWKSLIPADPRKGDRADVDPRIRKRLFCTICIDYMEGSVNALLARETHLSLTVESVTPQTIWMRLDGTAKLGKELEEKARKEKNTRGSEVRVLGYVFVDRAKNEITRFDIVGLGLAWGNKMEYVHREIRLDEFPWMYGIAVELVTTRRPIDLVPPYNMLHYGSGLKYFDEK